MMLLKTMSHEDESILENTESKGLHRNVWKHLLEKIETADNSSNASNFNEIVKSVRTYRFYVICEIFIMFHQIEN